MGGNILVIAPNQTPTTTEIDLTQTLYLYFQADASFCCDNINAFQPHLPNGESHRKGYLSQPYNPVSSHVNEYIHWRSGDYGDRCDDNALVVNEVSLADKSPQPAAKAPVATPLVTHVIHIGPGSTVVPLAKLLVTNPELARAVREDWKAAQHLLEGILRNSANLDPSIKPVLELLLHDGEDAYRTITREEQHG